MLIKQKVSLENFKIFKGFIDLSKRRVNTEEIVKVEDRYNKAKTVQSILLHVSEMTDVDLEILCKNISWPLYQKFGHAYNAFKFSLTDPEKAFEGILFDTEDIKKCLLQTIKNRMQDKPVKIRADLEITCFGYEGIEGIKNSIKEGELLSDKEVSFKISLIAPPLYVILGHTTDPNFGIEVLTKCIDVMKKKISEYDGKVVIKANPRAVTAREDHSLNLLLEQLREEKESSGESEDESSEEEEYIGM